MKRGRREGGVLADCGSCRKRIEELDVGEIGRRRYRRRRRLDEVRAVRVRRRRLRARAARRVRRDRVIALDIGGGRGSPLRRSRRAGRSRRLGQERGVGLDEHGRHRAERDLAAAGFNRRLRRNSPQLPSQSSRVPIFPESASPRPATSGRKRPRAAVPLARRSLRQRGVDRRQRRPRTTPASSTAVSLAHRVRPPAALLLVQNSRSRRDVCKSQCSARRLLLIRRRLRRIEPDCAAELGTVARAWAELECAHAAPSITSACRREHLRERAGRRHGR